jgi:hypothetical protein
LFAGPVLIFGENGFNVFNGETWKIDIFDYLFVDVAK